MIYTHSSILFKNTSTFHSISSYLFSYQLSSIFPMANSTAFLGCSHSYSNVEENLKLFAQLVYLVPAFLLIGRMIYVINFVYKDDFHDQERFWNLYSTDLILVGFKGVAQTTCICLSGCPNIEVETFSFFSSKLSKFGEEKGIPNQKLKVLV